MILRQIDEALVLHRHESKYVRVREGVEDMSNILVPLYIYNGHLNTIFSRSERCSKRGEKYYDFEISDECRSSNQKHDNLNI